MTKDAGPRARNASHRRPWPSKPLTGEILRGLYALVSLGSADIEGEDVKDWFADTTNGECANAVGWLHHEMAIRGMLGPQKESA